jgi:hypothetical protein
MQTRELEGPTCMWRTSKIDQGHWSLGRRGEQVDLPLPPLLHVLTHVCPMLPELSILGDSILAVKPGGVFIGPGRLSLSGQGALSGM